MDEDENLVEYCPMCGDKDITYFSSDDKLHDGKIYFDVGCRKCGATTLIYIIEAKSNSTLRPFGGGDLDA